jgi:hypothetical protein
MDIADKFEKVGVRVDQNGFVTPLKDVTRLFVFSIEPRRITLTQILNDSRQRYLPHLNHKMDVIGHQAECVNAVRVTFVTLLDQAMKP